MCKKEQQIKTHTTDILFIRIYIFSERNYLQRDLKTN